MTRRASPWAAVATMVVAAGCAPRADLPRSEQTVEGVTVYLGVVPAAIVQGHSTVPGDLEAMHGGTEEGSASHHVMVALFDAATGARITDARVEAGTEGGPHAKRLEAMQVNGLMTYGNFFAFEDQRMRRIRVEIRLPGRTAPIEASFAYRHEPGV